MNKRINVFFHGILVGTLAKIPNKNLVAFKYDDEWIKNGFSISPISLPLKNEVFIPKKTYFNGLFGTFFDSLPDSWGRLLLDKYLKSKGKLEDIDELDKLSYSSNSSMGALEYVPQYEISNEEIFDFDAYQINCNKILDNNDNPNIDLLYKYGGSSGGTRPKALVNINNEDWIIKFQSKYDNKDSGLIEYEYALACIELGIDMPEVKLFDSKENSGYFGIKRFDRINNQRIHMISVSALLEIDYNTPSLDYDDLFKLTAYLTKNNKNDLENLFLRMCFNVFAHNLDDHAKNFSFIYKEDEKCYRLSPAYDMTYSNTYYGEHTTSVNGKGRDILDNDLLIVGLKYLKSESKCKDLISRCKEIVNRRLSKYIKGE